MILAEKFWSKTKPLRLSGPMVTEESLFKMYDAEKGRR